METCYMWTIKQDTERGEKMEVLVWNILLPIYLLTPESTTTPGQHVWFTGSPDSKGHGCINIQRTGYECHTQRRRPLHSNPHYTFVFPDLDFCCSCCIQLQEEPMTSSKANVVFLCQMNLPNISSLLKHIQTQVNTLSDPTPSLGNLLAHWFKFWGKGRGWLKKKLL